MKICENCFADKNIKGIIRSGNIKGKCDICGATDCFIYDTEIADSLVPYFDEIFSAYTPSSELKIDFPNNKKAFLAEKLKRDWNLFVPNLTIEDVNKIIKAVSLDAYDNYPALFTEKVGVAAFQDEELLSRRSILKGSSWEDFVYKIKCVNRFHIRDFNEERLEYYCRLLTQIYKCGTCFYRTRIKKDSSKKPFSKKEMSAPPPNLSGNGRINPKGISCLYLCEDKDTPFYETRAQHLDYVYLAEFQLKKDISIADLGQIKKINPVIIDSTEGIASDYLINKTLLEKISSAMTRPQRSGDSELEYLPTQFIADFIKSLVKEDNSPLFRGIAFESAAHPGFNNLASFYPDDFDVGEIKLYEVNQLNYQYREIMKH